MLLFAVAVALALVAAAQGAVFVVDVTADELDSACVPADCSLREAVVDANAAVGPDQIVVPAGTYVLSIPDVPPAAGEDMALTGDLDLNDSVTITGAGRDATIVDGGGIARVFEVAALGVPVVAQIADLTIRGGDTFVPAEGGGIHNQADGVLTLADVAVSENEDGGIANLGTLTIEASLVTDNVNAGGGGGGIANTGILDVTETEISGNQSQFGGGILQAGADGFTLTDSVVTGNTADGGGGGIAVGSGDGTAVDSEIALNGTAGEGGGIIFFGNELTLTRVRLHDNTADVAGGGLSNYGTAALTDTAVFLNATGGSGGGIANQGDLFLTNDTISTNTAGADGGGLTNSANATLAHVTLAHNVAASGGGVFTSPGALTTFKNTILAYSDPENCGGDPNASSTNNVSDDLTCVAEVRADPLLGPLAIEPPGTTEVHPLLAGSPALDTATACPPPATDQRGIPRPQGAACDIGAYEVEQGPQCANLKQLEEEEKQLHEQNKRAEEEQHRQNVEAEEEQHEQNAEAEKQLHEQNKKAEEARHKQAKKAAHGKQEKKAEKQLHKQNKKAEEERHKAAEQTERERHEQAKQDEKERHEEAERAERERHEQRERELKELKRSCKHIA